MTTRLRVRWVGASVMIALAGATLAVSATPAAAAPPTIRIESVSSDNVKSGGTVRVRFRVTNNDRGTERAFVAVSGGLRCTKGCSATKDLGPGASATFDATVVAPKVNVGEESGRNLAVTVRIGLQTGFAHKMILVRGADQPSTAVTQVSGRVRDTDGKAVGGATVAVKDSAGHTFQATSDGGGKFSIRSGDSKPIAHGSLTVAAGKDGYRTARVTAQGVAGSAATVRLVLVVVAAPTTTPPSPTAEASSPAAADEPVAEESSAGVAAPATVKTAGDQGGGLLLFTILGGLLVVAGLGALALVLIRRRKSSAEPGPPAYPGAGGGFADAPTALMHTVPPDSRSFR